MNEEAKNTEQNIAEGSDASIDPAISRHLDIAIEAQDGKSNAETEDKDKEGEEGDKSKQPEDSKSSAGDDKQEQRPVDKEISEAAKKLAGAKDLKLHDGTVVKGGAERRFYEQRETARHELSIEKQAHQATRQQLQSLQERLSLVENSTKELHGADAKTLAIGAKIVNDIQSDPVGTIKKLVAEAAAQGYNVEDLGVGVDTAAIKRLIEERLPLNEPKEKTDDEIAADAEAEVAKFYSAFPDAKPHDALLAAVLRDHPELDLQSAYFAVKNSFIDKGFDWSLSLEDNLKAAQSDPQNKDNQQNSDQDKKPLPSGGYGAGGEFKLNDKSIADDSMDTGDIVRQAMRESGINI